MGIGIHGEPGRERVPLRRAREVAEQLTSAVVSDLPFRRGDTAILMVNGMGGTPMLELYLMYNEVASILNAGGIEPARRLVGNYITSLDMAGCSVTLLRADEEMLSLWDDPVLTPGLRWGV